MKAETRWTGPAVDDLKNIRDWTATTRSSAETKAIVKRLTSATLALGQMPNRGRPGRLVGTRELVLAPFIVVYRVDEMAGAVEILRVLHGARNWPSK
jgi:toxin ParE1/3/4